MYIFENLVLKIIIWVITPEIYYILKHDPSEKYNIETTLAFYIVYINKLSVSTAA